MKPTDRLAFVGPGAELAVDPSNGNALALLMATFDLSYVLFVVGHNFAGNTLVSNPPAIFEKCGDKVRLRLLPRNMGI